MNKYYVVKEINPNHICVINGPFNRNVTAQMEAMKETGKIEIWTVTNQKVPSKYAPPRVGLKVK